MDGAAAAMDGAAGAAGRALQGLPEGYNWFLILVAVVMTCAVLAVNVYVIVHYQHPEDRNQAWLPKFIVLLGLTLAELSVLMVPLDVANRAACADHISISACKLSMPMPELWYTVYLLGAVLIFFVIPFAGFLYEADSDLTLFAKVRSSLMYMTATFVVMALTLGLAYGLAGYAQYTVDDLVSEIAPLSAAVGEGCLGGGSLCDGAGAPTTDWSVRVSFPVYVVAVTTIVGWLLFMVFAGIGVTALPLDWIQQYFHRPRATISRAEYIRKARGLARQAKEIKELAGKLRRDEQLHGKGRKWKKSLKQLNQQMHDLEDAEDKLAEVFPQGEGADSAWAMTVIGYGVKLVLGVICLIISILLVVHIVLYIFITPPVDPFLNTFFIDLDKVFPLFGTAAFGLFCFYLIAITIKGCTKFGMSIFIFTLHPMKVGKTMMSSLLFNVAIILLCSSSVIQFCNKAFAVYAKDSTVGEIFGNQLENLLGLKYLFKYNGETAPGGGGVVEGGKESGEGLTTRRLAVFIYCFFGSTVLSALVLLLRARRGGKAK